MRSPNGTEMNSGLKKGSWSKEEDELLKSYIKRYGIWNWSHMPKYAGLMRSGKSCRLRWMNYLKPNVKRGKFSTEEEDIILHYHSLLGNRWSAIASKLSGRSDNEIKNYWHTHLKKRMNCISTRQFAAKHDTKLSTMCKSNVAETKKQDDYAYSCFEPLFSQTCDDDSSSSSSSSSTTFKDDGEVRWNDDYYDLCSPGTVKDLQGFWNQLCPIENLDLGTSNEDVSFELPFWFSHNDTTSSYNV